MSGQLASVENASPIDAHSSPLSDIPAVRSATLLSAESEEDTRPFRPRLQFTDNAVWEEDSSGPDISLQLLRRDQYYALPAHIIVGDAVSFVISGFPCNKDSHNKGVLIWFEVSINCVIITSSMKFLAPLSITHTKVVPLL